MPQLNLEISVYKVFSSTQKLAVKEVWQIQFIHTGIAITKTQEKGLGQLGSSLRLPMVQTSPAWQSYHKSNMLTATHPLIPVPSNPSTYCFSFLLLPFLSFMGPHMFIHIKFWEAFAPTGIYLYVCNYIQRFASPAYEETYYKVRDVG